MAARKRARRRRTELPPLRSASVAPTDPPAPKRTDYTDWQESLTPAETIVGQIEDLMLAGRWAAGRSDKLLAQELGRSPSYIRSLAAEASRGLRRFVRDQDADFRHERRAQLIAVFGAVQQRAMAMNTPNALRVVLEAAELQGRYLGVEPPKVLEVNRRGEFDDLTDSKVAAIANGEDDEDDERRDNVAH
jgi:hypothetical protein